MLSAEIFKRTFSDVRVTKFQPAPRNPISNGFRTRSKVLCNLRPGVSSSGIGASECQESWLSKSQLRSMRHCESFERRYRNSRIPDLEPSKHDPPQHNPRADMQEICESFSCISVGHFATLAQPRESAPHCIRTPV